MSEGKTSTVSRDGPLSSCPFCEGPPVPFVRFTDVAGKVIRDPHIDEAPDGLFAEAEVFCHECGVTGPHERDIVYTMEDVERLKTQACHSWNTRDSRHRDLYDSGLQAGHYIEPHVERRLDAPAGWRLVPEEITPEMLAAAASGVVPTASFDDIQLARKAAPRVILSGGAPNGEGVDMVAALLATMPPFYRAMVKAAPKPPAADRRSTAALAWAVSTFGSVAADPQERAMRFVEEALEAGMAIGLTAEVAMAIIARVYEGERGNPAREIGQAAFTLALLAETLALEADRLGAVEFDRVRTVPREEWQRRHAAKVSLGIAK